MLSRISTNWAIRSFSLFSWAIWANRSGRSPNMSDVSELLRSLTKNERMSKSLIFLSELLIRSFFRLKQAIRSEKPMSEFPALLKMRP